MVKKIALFNHKGGVSKTTTTFNVGWMLASKGKKVIMVDADPQCNLTGMVLDYRGAAELEVYYRDHPNQNLMAGLSPTFEAKLKPIEPVDCYPVTGRSNLYLLPGHIRLSEYDLLLGISQELSGSIQTLKNLPGSLNYLLTKTAERHNADYILIDMSPSLSSMNQNALMTSDYFIVPTSPDYFSVMAIDSLSNVLPNWAKWAKKAHKMEMLKNTEYPFPVLNPKFLGTVVQKYRPRGGAPARAFQTWIDQIENKVISSLIPRLKEQDMLLSENTYRQAGVNADYCLAEIPDFNTLIAKSQETQTPVFALTEEQLDRTGVVLETTLSSIEQFRVTFSNLVDKILKLTGDND